MADMVECQIRPKGFQAGENPNATPVPTIFEPTFTLTLPGVVLEDFTEEAVARVRPTILADVENLLRTYVHPSPAGDFPLQLAFVELWPVQEGEGVQSTTSHRVCRFDHKYIFFS